MEETRCSSLPESMAAFYQSKVMKSLYFPMKKMKRKKYRVLRQRFLDMD